MYIISLSLESGPPSTGVVVYASYRRAQLCTSSVMRFVSCQQNTAMKYIVSFGPGGARSEYVESLLERSCRPSLQTKPAGVPAHHRVCQKGSLGLTHSEIMRGNVKFVSDRGLFSISISIHCESK